MTNAYSIDTSVSKQTKKRATDTKSFIAKAIEVHNGFYSYEKSVYKKSSVRIIITCPLHGDFSQIAANHIRGKGCPKCSGNFMDTDIFIKKSIIEHDGFYTYANTVYVNSTSKVVITCPIHGDFLQTPNGHIQGKGCLSCGVLKSSENQTSNTDDFINKAVKIHGNKYAYRKVDYKAAIKKVVITCREHGDFKQTPNAHLSGNGCVKCGAARTSAANSKSGEQFLSDARKTHGNRYSYSKVVYEGSHSKVKINCRIHGCFEQLPVVHIRGAGCPDCGKDKSARARSLTRDDFIKRASIVHSEKYNYDKVVYVNFKTHVIVNCPEHGDFSIVPSNHVFGQGIGCAKCTVQLNGFRRSVFKDRCARNDGMGFLYVIKCNSEKEVFYKIGITCNSVEERYRSKTAMPYEYKTIFVIKNNAEFVFDIERSLHKLLKPHQHEPKKPFGGQSECFTTIKPIKRLLEELESTHQLQLLA